MLQFSNSKRIQLLKCGTAPSKFRSLCSAHSQLFNFTAAVLSIPSALCCSDAHFDVSSDIDVQNSNEQFELSFFLVRRGNCPDPPQRDALTSKILSASVSIQIYFNHRTLGTPPTIHNQLGKYVLQEYIIAQMEKPGCDLIIPKPKRDATLEKYAPFKSLWYTMKEDLDELERQLESLARKSPVQFAFLFHELVNQLYPSILPSKTIDRTFSSYLHPKGDIFNVLNDTLRKFHEAIEMQRNDVVRNMMKKVPAIGGTVDPYTHMSAMDIAVCVGNTEAQEELKKHGVEIPRNPEKFRSNEIVYAASSGNLPLFRQWVESNRSNLNSTEDNMLDNVLAKIGLIDSMSRSQRPRRNSIGRSNRRALNHLVGAVNILLANGADPNCAVESGESVLKAVQKYNAVHCNGRNRTLLKCIRLMTGEEGQSMPRRLQQSLQRGKRRVAERFREFRFA